MPKLDDWVLPIGKARIMREGKDVTIVSYSIGVGLALEAADKLASEGIDAEVIDLRTLRPLDKATVLKSPRQDQPPGRGRGRLADLLDRVARSSRSCMEEGFDDLDAPVLRVVQRGRAAALCREPGEAGADQRRPRSSRR